VNSFRNTRRTAWFRHRYEFISPDDKQRYLDSIPDKTVAQSDYAALATGVAQLPEKLRTVLVLKYVSGYSENDVAQLLHIPPGTVKSRLFNARRQLKERL